MYFCHNGNGIIPIPTCWTSDTVDFVNKTLSAIACGYICSYIFYVLTVLWSKAEKIMPILDIAKEDIRYAKDSIGGFFMNNGGCNDVKAMTVYEILNCLADKKDNLTVFYTIVKKETEWLMLLNIVEQIRNNLQFIKNESDYLNFENLDRIKAVEENWRISYTLLSSRKINYARLIIDENEKTEIDKIVERELTISKGDLTKLSKNIKELYKNLEDLHSHL